MSAKWEPTPEQLLADLHRYRRDFLDCCRTGMGGRMEDPAEGCCVNTGPLIAGRYASAVRNAMVASGTSSVEEAEAWLNRHVADGSETVTMLRKILAALEKGR